MRMGLIGFGYWGEKLARCFSAAQVDVAFLAETAPERREKALRRFQSARITADWLELLRDSAIDAVAIATPADTHHDIAKAALEAGKHVWIEKPVAETARQARALVALAERQERVLFIDHTFIHSDSVRLMKRRISETPFGDVLNYNSLRINNGLPRNDASIFHDLAIHDLSILDFLTGQSPSAVSVTDAPAARGAQDSGRRIALSYPSALRAEINVNWCAPSKARRVVVSSSSQSLEFDDTELHHKLRLYEFALPAESAFSFREFDAGRRNGSVLPVDAPGNRWPTRSTSSCNARRPAPSRRPTGSKVCGSPRSSTPAWLQPTRSAGGRKCRLRPSPALGRPDQAGLRFRHEIHVAGRGFVGVKAAIEPPDAVIPSRQQGEHLRDVEHLAFREDYRPGR